MSLLAALTCIASAARADGLDPLAVRTEPAPFHGVANALSPCEPDLVLVSANNGLFASRDGVRWRREELADDLYVSRAICIDGVTWGVGRPGLIARREPGGRWVVDHLVEDLGDGERPPRVEGIRREPFTRRLHASGFRGYGERFELVRSPEGVWSEVSPRRGPAYSFQADPAAGGPECRVPRLPAPVLGARFARAARCPGGRVVVWTREGARDPDAVIPLAAEMRAEEWRVLGTSQDAVFLVLGIRHSELIDEVTHHAFARWRGGRWAATWVEDRGVSSMLVQLRGAPFVVGARRVHWFD